MGEDPMCIRAMRAEEPEDVVCDAKGYQIGIVSNDVTTYPTFRDVVDAYDAAIQRAEAAEKQVREFEEREASCCPEDVGCDEYIAHLTRELAAARSVDADDVATLNDAISFMNSWQQDAEGTAQWSAWDEGVRERLRTLRDTRNTLADAVRLYDEKWRAIVADHAVVQRELAAAREDGALESWIRDYMALGPDDDIRFALVQRAEELAAAREVFRQVPLLRCEWLHHKKSERHDYNVPCTVSARLNKAIGRYSIDAVAAARTADGMQGEGA